MLLKKISCYILLVLLVPRASAQSANLVQVSMGKVKLDFVLDADGTPTYAVQYNQQQVIAPSRLGFSLTDDRTFYKGFKLLHTSRRTVNESWQPVWGR